ncbi:MAG TPA: cyclic pyranopterin monophosphate synthase MoaC [Phycisphaerales bacterium]|nr:cyclic pyranopterin monophosphate synthase MoaC [Phycisphaerales bacterium]HMP38663.1 cyclic pyranopterin monophosphate synthase MoaC [Phycisphaerales bacterium]
MVDVSGKPPLVRRAVAEGCFVARPQTIDAIVGPGVGLGSGLGSAAAAASDGGGPAGGMDAATRLPKGDAIAAARIAGILAAKRCGELIPLCHTLPLEHVALDFERIGPERLRIVASTKSVGRTGVEMEALVAVATAALTLWDMTKAIDGALRIDAITLVEKTKSDLAQSGAGDPAG